MKKLFTVLLIAFAFVGNVSGQTTDLFFSEYLEGSSNNKAFEIFNGTGADINFGTTLYVVRNYNNGAVTANGGFTLTGVLLNNGTYVIANGSANATILSLATVTVPASGGVTSVNGDDAVVLEKNGVIIDAIGQVGFDPGSNWTANGVATSELTLIRKAAICAGDANSTNAFDPSVEWFALPQDNTSSLGTHTISGCTSPSQSSAKAITGFTVAGVAANISGTNITATVPFGTTLSGISALGTISALATVNPSFATTQDFSSLVNYTVTAEDLSTQIYNVSVTSTPASSAKLITFFNFPGQSGSTISGNNIFVSFPSGSTITSLSPSAEVSNDATVSPAFGTSQDFTNPVLYTVTAQDGSTNVYTVVSTIAVTLSSAKDITNFTVAGVPATISGTTISATVPFGTNLTNIAPIGLISAASTVNPAFTVPQSFGSMVSYTVTAQDLSTKIYNVTVTALPAISPITPISTLRNSLDASGVTTISGSTVVTVAGQVYGFNGRTAANQLEYVLIDNSGAGIRFVATVAGLTLAEGDLATVVGTLFNNSGQLQISSTNIQKGSSGNARVQPIVVTSLGENLESRLVTIVLSNINIANWNATPSTSFNVNATIAGSNINTPLRIWTYNNQLYGKRYSDIFGTHLPTSNITLTGIVGQNVASAPFTTGFQLYPYLASDVKSPAAIVVPTAAAITTFSLLNQVSSTVVGNNINILVPTGYNVNVVPFEILFSPGASILPAITAQQNFSSAVNYTVTSQNAATVNVYTVNVTVKPVTYFNTPYSTNFDISPLNNGLSFIQVAGPRGWSYFKSGATANIEGNAFSSSTTTDLPTESWAVFNFSISGFTSASVSMDILNRFADSGELNPFNIYYSTDYSGIGNPNAASWTSLTGFSFPAPVNDNTSYSPITPSAFSIGNSSTFYLGFRYKSSGETTGKATTWRVDNLTVTGKTIVAPSTLAGFNSIKIAAFAPLGLFDDAIGTIAGSTINFSVGANVTVNGLLFFYEENAGAKVSIANGSSPSLLYNASNNTYSTSVVVTAAGGNTATYTLNIKQEISTVSGVKSATELSDLKVFPNPSNGTFTVAAAKGKSIEIFNLIGSKVASAVLTDKLSTITLDQPKGVYYLKVTSISGGVSVKRIVIE